MTQTSRGRGQVEVAHGFTLIELLVVITIIVILLALLTPALDRAVYEAELAVCGTQQKGIVSGGHLYAMDFKRQYPHRAGMRKNWEPEMLYEGNPNGPQHDTRKSTRGYIQVKAFVDPLCESVDLGSNARSNGVNDPNQIWILSSYNVWFDAQYNSGSIRYKGLFKLGDRFTWRDPADPDATEFSFALVVNDRDSYNPTAGLGNEAHFSHPDADGVLVNERLEDEDFTVDSGVSGVEVPNDHVTVSFWRSRTTHLRGVVDGNYGYDDGSVTRHRDVGLSDERMARLPEWVNHNSWGNGAGWGTQVPKAN